LGIVTVVAVGAWMGGDRLVTQQGLMLGFGVTHLACTLVAAQRLRNTAHCPHAAA
ncbi:MAG: hypothetical protein RL328_547, partial [Acidobacteriota bacterium]